ncbi:MAG TPA: ester cyclase, partial [Acidimicrobiales bacterium]|nr:ester cyclase [Acidimicrobiales bacterium]
ELGGVDAYCSMIDGFFGLLPDYRADVLAAAEAPDRLLVHWRIEGTAAGDRSISYTGCSVWRADGDRIVEGWLYPDRAAMLAQLDP